MEVERFIRENVNVKKLHFRAYVRYWEDGEFYCPNNKTTNCIIPGRDDQYWDCTIDIDSGKILNWIPGVVGDVCFKVCDEFSCEFIDDKSSYIYTIENDYVPDFMCPVEPGYGDYIIMNIDEDGKIENWSVHEVKVFLEEALKSNVIG